VPQPNVTVQAWVIRSLTSVQVRTYLIPKFVNFASNGNGESTYNLFSWTLLPSNVAFLVIYAQAWTNAMLRPVI